jgi:hypothetical protein
METFVAEHKEIADKYFYIVPDGLLEYGRGIKYTDNKTPRQKAARQTCSVVMSRAWSLAKEGAAKFGGNSREYIKEAMRLTWAQIKSQDTEAHLVVGNYANDITGVAI